MEAIVGPDEVDADLVVMMAGATVSFDPDATLDRGDLARENASVFRDYARRLATREEQRQGDVAPRHGGTSGQHLQRVADLLHIVPTR
ncbi:MAG: hypothetical protein U0904_03960 [Candidatus Nanopelagicales bacterium]|nr:hypothetical protein [Candidatus Nanopelagicales bacterium]